MTRFLYALIICLTCSTMQASLSSAASIEQSIIYKGETRSYRIFIPSDVAQHKNKVAAVIALHGGGGTGQNAEDMTGFSEKATKEGFIAIYPDGSSPFRKLKTWNSWHCCGYAMTEKIDDVGFISALIDHLIKTQPIDADKIFVTGMSNGGMMTHRIGVELSNKVRAIAPVVSGIFVDTPTPVGMVPAIIINGALDESFPMNGGQTGGRFKKSWDGTDLLPVKTQGTFWATQNQCQKHPKTDQTETYWHLTYRCPSKNPVEHYILKDNGHAWPGGKKGRSLGDTPTTSMIATDVIWDFFKQF